MPGYAIHAMPCYARLCHAMLCYAMLCCGMLCYAIHFLQTVISISIYHRFQLLARPKDQLSRLHIGAVDVGVLDVVSGVKVKKLQLLIGEQAVHDC